MKVFVSIPQNGNVFETFITKEVRELMEGLFEVVYSPYEKNITQEQFKEAVGDAEVIITGWGHPQITYDMVNGTNIKAIAHTGGSVGSLVTPEIYDNGIMVMSGNLMYADSVAEGTIAYILTALRDIPKYTNNVKAGKWQLDTNYTEGLLDGEIGIIGMGAISKFLIQFLQPLRVKIKAYSGYPIDPDFLEKYNVTQVSLEEALQCKVVSLHSAMNERTRGLIGKEQFKLIKDGAVFVNTARGRVVDEPAMIEELKTGRFKAILDVFYHEPLEADSPLRTLENVYCVPHMAGPTVDRRAKITAALVRNIVDWTEGKEVYLEITKEQAARMTVGG